MVKEAFIHLFDTGVIRRGIGIVNWCYALQTSLADIEVDEVEFNGRTKMRVPGYENPVDFGLLYYCAYKIQNSGRVIAIRHEYGKYMFSLLRLLFLFYPFRRSKVSCSNVET